MWTLNSEISVETKSKCMRASSGLCKHTYSEVSYILYTVYSKGGRNSDQIVGFVHLAVNWPSYFFVVVTIAH